MKYSAPGGSVFKKDLLFAIEIRIGIPPSMGTASFAWKLSEIEYLTNSQASSFDFEPSRIGKEARPTGEPCWVFLGQGTIAKSLPPPFST